MRFCRFLIFCFCGALQIFESKAEKGDVDRVVNSTVGTNDKVREISQQIAASKLAIISLKDVAKNSKAGRSVENQIEEINNKSKDDLLELENSIKKMDSDAKTSSDERKVEDLQVILYDMTKEKRYQIQSAYRSAIEVLENEIHKVVKEIAEERGYSLIVLSDIVVFGTSECPDITEEAIRRLDNRIPEIKVDISKKNPEGR